MSARKPRTWNSKTGRLASQKRVAASAKTANRKRAHASTNWSAKMWTAALSRAGSNSQQPMRSDKNGKTMATKPAWNSQAHAPELENKRTGGSCQSLRNARALIWRAIPLATSDTCPREAEKRTRVRINHTAASSGWQKEIAREFSEQTNEIARTRRRQ